MSTENPFSKPVQSKDASAPFMIDPQTGAVLTEAEYKASLAQDTNNK